MRITHVMRLLAATAVLFAGASWAQAREYTEEFNKTVPLAAGAHVSVENVNGKVEIIAWDRTDAEIHAVKRTNRSREELDQVSIKVDTSDGLNIRTNYRKYDGEDDSFFSMIFGGVGRRPKVSVDYTIHIPRTADLRNAQTVNGTVILRGTHGNTKASSTNGDVSAEGVDRVETASTTNGSIYVIGTSISEASTVNGGIEVTVTTPNPEGMSFSSVNGAVTVKLLSTVNADVELSTVNGHVSVPDGLTLKAGRISNKRVSGRLGSGGRTIRASTVNGSVSLNSSISISRSISISEEKTRSKTKSKTKFKDKKYKDMGEE